MVLDLSEYKSANGAAKAAGEKIKEIADEMGQKPDLEVTVEKRAGRFGDYWAVSWTGGPFDWAITLTGGESLYAAEIPEVRQGENEAEITGFRNEHDWTVECENRTTLGFYSQ